jgi:small subunit ribosomal protein S21
MLIIKDIKRIEYALKEYRKKVSDTKMMDELRSRKEFKKKSQRKREEINAAKYRNLKNGN